MLRRAIGIQERPADIHDGLPVPPHGEPGVFLHQSHLRGLKVLRRRQGQECFLVPGGHHHRHPLLAFRDGQFRSVQALVLLRNRVQVNVQPVRQFPDSHGHAAGAKVIAPLDQLRGRGIAEQPLQLPLLRGVALLHLRPAGFHAVGIMGLGGSGGPADAVPAGGPAQQDHHVPGSWPLPAHVFRRSRGDDRPDLHPLGRVAGMV